MAPDRVKPAFVLSRDLPPTGDRPISTREICGAAENLTGYDTIDGAQQIGGLWRIYPKTNAARLMLLVSGVVVRNVQVRTYDDNPFLVRGAGDGPKMDTTKVFISNIPISFSNTEIEKALTNLGSKLVSKMIDECDREDNGRLTRWKTGRRFVYIAMPSTPLPTQINIGPFTARIFHREQKVDRQPFCGNCLSKGHRKQECTAMVVCRACKQSGHRSGDSLCEGTVQSVSDGREVTPQPHNESEAATTTTTTMADSDADDSDDSSSSEGKEMKKNKHRMKKRKVADRSINSPELQGKEAKIEKTVGSSGPDTDPNNSDDRDESGGESERIA